MSIHKEKRFHYQDLLHNEFEDNDEKNPLEDYIRLSQDLTIKKQKSAPVKTKKFNSVGRNTPNPIGREGLNEILTGS